MKSKKKTKEQLAWKKHYPEGKACFAWNQKDYQIWQLKSPSCILENSTKTEGEQISDTDLESWFCDSFKALKIIKETEPEIFKKIYQGFILDIKYLISIKRIEKEKLDITLDEKNFIF